MLIGATIVLLVGLLAFLSSEGAGAAGSSGCRRRCCSAERSGTWPTGCATGAVTDFIDLPLWPTFNLADVCIVVGVLLLLLDVERSEGRREGS